MSQIARVRSCLLGVAVIAGCTGSPDTTTPTATADRQLSVSFAEAVETAKAEVPDGIPYEVELEQLEGSEVIEVEFLVGATVREVYIDPATGDVLAVRDEAAEHTEQTQEELETQAGMMSSAQISLADAAQIASDHSGGQAEEVEFKVLEGRLVAEVEVQTNAGESVVLVDASTGEVLEGDAEPEPEDDDPEGE